MGFFWDKISSDILKKKIPSVFLEKLQVEQLCDSLHILVFERDYLILYYIKPDFLIPRIIDYLLAEKFTLQVFFIFLPCINFHMNESKNLFNL